MAGGGGGAWKVAYADFVTAMMALFLVLWIISQDEQIKGNVQQYFRTRFASVTKQSVGIIPIENADLIRAKRAHFDKAAAIPLDQVRRLNDDLKKVFADNPEFIDMKFSMRMTDEGLLIEFFNDPNRRLFRDGVSEMTDYGNYEDREYTKGAKRLAATVFFLPGFVQRRCPLWRWKFYMDLLFASSICSKN